MDCADIPGAAGEERRHRSPQSDLGAALRVFRRIKGGGKAAKVSYGPERTPIPDLLSPWPLQSNLLSPSKGCPLERALLGSAREAPVIERARPAIRRGSSRRGRRSAPVIDLVFPSLPHNHFSSYRVANVHTAAHCDISNVIFHHVEIVAIWFVRCGGFLRWL